MAEERHELQLGKGQPLARAVSSACVRWTTGGSPAWLAADAGSAARLARAIHQGRAFDGLPALGDA
ncbi:MAG: hypothetical protein L0Z62_48050 [Gemmataceae bacterium]|nr:hypothetical protein [Gemmataceae bacterium]